MSHVGAFRGARKTEREAAELVGGHDKHQKRPEPEGYSFTNMIIRQPCRKSVVFSESEKSDGLIGHRRTVLRQCAVEDAGLLLRRLPTRRDCAMGDKGGKKDKEKSKKQKAIKQEQSAKGKKPSK